MRHDHRHAFNSFNAQEREGLVLVSRRNVLKASLAGLAGLSLPALLQARATGQAKPRKSVILLWMAGGPSHIDTWDPKPDRPAMNRGPFGTVQSSQPGVRLCDLLPRHAAMLDRFTIIRSVDCRYSNHEPNKVMQTANLDAEPRLSKTGNLYPAIGSLVAKHHGPNHPAMPPYVTFMKSTSHVAFAGYLGKRYDPFQASTAVSLPIYDLVGNDTGNVTNVQAFRLPSEVTADRVHERRKLVASFDDLRKNLDASGQMEAMDHYSRQAVEFLVGRQARDAFDINREPTKIRDRYGKHLWCQQALLARRLVEAGSAFVTLDLSYHTASGTWDTHGDNIPPYGGIKKGLGPLLPLFDHLLTTLVGDLEQRGLLDEVLVIAMGEFGRTPMMGTQDSTDGRNHWPQVMSMALAGGGLRHGQVIGATEADGGHIKSRPVSPGDLAATIYKHFGIPLETTWLEPSGRPRAIIDHGAPIDELF